MYVYIYICIMNVSLIRGDETVYVFFGEDSMSSYHQLLGTFVTGSFGVQLPF